MTTLKYDKFCNSNPYNANREIYLLEFIKLKKMEKKNRLESEIWIILKNQKVPEYSPDVYSIIFRLKRISASANLGSGLDWVESIKKLSIYNSILAPAVGHSSADAFLQIIEPLANVTDNKATAEHQDYTITPILSSNQARIVEIGNSKFNFSAESFDQIRREIAEAILFFERNQPRVDKITS